MVEVKSPFLPIDLYYLSIYVYQLIAIRRINMHIYSLDYPLYISPSIHDNYLDYKVFLAEEITYTGGVVLTIGDAE